MADTYTLLDEQTSTPYSMGPGEHARVLPSSVLDKRAVKASLATGKPIEEVRPAMETAEGEQSIRDYAQQQADINFYNQKLGLVKELSKSTEPMTVEKASMVMALTQDNVANKPSDSELEKQYSEKAYSFLVANPTNQTYMEANNADTEKTQTYQDIATSTTRTYEFMRKLHEDNDTWDAAGGKTGYLWDIGEQLIPFKSWWNKYDSEVYGVATGSNMLSQIEEMWLQPPEVREDWIKARYDTIASYNKQDAQEWLAGMTQYSSRGAAMDNLFNLVDAASVLPMGMLGKAVKGAKAVRTGEGVSKAGAEALARAEKIAAYQAELKPIEEKLQAGMFKRSPDDIMRRDFLRAQIKALRAEEDVKTGLKQTAEALATKENDPVKILAQTGNVDEAVNLEVQTAIQEAKTGVPIRSEDVRKLDTKLLSIYNPASWLGARKNLSGEAARRILEGTEAARAPLRKVFDNPMQAIRLTEEALTRGVEQTKAKLRQMYVNASDSVIDANWRVVAQEDSAKQVNEVVMTLGDTNALPFATRDDAEQVAKHMYMIPEGNYEVVPNGKGFTIEVAAPVDETDPGLTSLLINTNNQTPKSVWNTFLGWMRSPEDLLSSTSRQNRNVVVPLAQETARLFEEAMAPSLSRLSKKQQKRMDELMKVNRDFQKGDERGRWFDNVAEYEQTYYDLYKTWPSEAETEAYMVIREMSDFDWAMRSLSITRDKRLQGLMKVTHKFRQEVPIQEQYLVGPDGVPKLDEQLLKMQDHEVSFEGKQVDNLPFDKNHRVEPGVFILREGDAASSEWNLLSKLDRAEVERMIKEEGYRVYQTSDPYQRPFSMLKGGDQNASFIVIKGGQQSNLKVTEQLPYKAGFHVEYPPGFYTKMPVKYRDASGREIYGGDKAIMFHSSEAQAKQYYKAFDEARLLLKDGKTDELKEFLKKNLPHSYEDFVRIFNDGVDVDTPVFYTKSGQTTRDASMQHMGHNSGYFKGLTDLADSEYNSMAFVNKKFAQEKNIELPSVEKGAEGNPVFAFRGSRTVSPLSTMNRAMHQMIRMHVYDNYQKQAVASFIEEFANPNVLGGSVTKRSIDSIRRNPISFLLDPMWEDNVIDKAKLAAAKNVHRSIVQLLGTPSDLSRNLDWVQNKILNTVFNYTGDAGVEKVADFLHTKLRDPAKYARSIAFHTKLGLFNPVQLFLQGQSIVHAAAVTGNPVRSYKAGAGSSLMRLLSLTDDENVIKSFAKKASFFGWKEDDFVEAFKVMREAGIWNVEGDVAMLDDVLSQKLFRGRAAKFLDKGTIFFKEGERFVRLNAFNTAYLEWKAANTGKQLTQREIAKVLTRYDDLALNMTRKSTAAFQQGVFSLPTQFSTYQIHLAEQILGKRLTKAERARVVSMYSLMYGLPAGASATLLYPFGEDIKQAAMERGIDTNDGVMDLLINGIMSNAVEMATGKETNIGERYGPLGLSFIKDAFTGDKNLVQLAFGPSGQATADLVGGMFDTAVPVIAALAAGDKNLGNESYPLMFEDVVQRLSTVSSVNNAVKLYRVANYQKFFSKNENFQVDADIWDGILSAVFGADPRAISDAYAKLESIKEVKDYKMQKMKDVTKNMKRAAEHFKQPEEWARYMKAAGLDAIEGGLTPMDYQRAMRDALNGMDTSFVEGINEAFIRSRPPEMQWKMRTEQIEKVKK